MEKIDPITFAVISARINGIISEMSEVLLRTSRNPILYSAKDFTCGILTGDAKLLTMVNGMPVHIYGLRNSLKGVVQAFGDDIHPGDCFVNNSPYHGNNHVGDWSMFAPVFYDGELIFWAASLCHLIDSGAYKATNLDSLAKDIYEEGIHFPPLRLLKDYKEIPDIVAFIKANFRYPEQWHGDFLAQVGSLWMGEQECLNLCKKYGNKVMKSFQHELLDYGDRRMTEEIKKLPKGTWAIEDQFEKVEPLAPDGLPLKVKVTISPDEAVITFDLTEMPDQLPWGLNCSRSTAEGACISGSMPSFDPSLPRNDGVYKHFKFILREGAVCGIPKWPVGTSMATVGVTDEVTAMIFRLWEKILPGKGHAAGGEINGAQCICSGTDFRHGNEPYGHLYFVAMSGGPASKGCDGWPSWLHNGAMGNQSLDSIELTELTSPVIVWEAGIATDSVGAGQWRGAPGLYHRIQPRRHTMNLVAVATGHTHPPRGAAGGKDGSLAETWIEDHDTQKKLRQLQNVGYYELKENEDWVAYCNGGGGYGDPFERDPEAVCDDARNSIISVKVARDVYGVVLDTNVELYKVDNDSTKKLRAQLNKKK
jgi:N-methylhydantoinase B